jgi:filamentous hemagglutinin family protein
MRVIPFLLIFTTGLLTSGMMLPTIAQVISDGTTNTIVNQSGNNFNILNGINKGNNLFHSFSNFSIPTGGSATFNLVNTPNINTIFSRVTGGNVSNIDGLIRTVNSNNPVSLFLMNPNGIIFGQNAKLDIGGSFLGTTGSSIKFADGSEFSAVNPAATPLLTMSVPIGLQMGSNPGAITVQGTGHTLTTSNVLGLSPIIQTSHTGLQVKPGKTLGLVGSNINFENGVLEAVQGRIEVGSIKEGMVKLESNPVGWILGYAGVNEFADVSFTKRSLLSTSGVNAGSMQVQGRQVNIQDKSVLLSQNQGILKGGDIRVNAAEQLHISNKTSNSPIRTGIITETVGLGSGSKIIVATPNLKAEDGSAITTRTFSPATSGDIEIKAANLVQVQGFSSLNPTQTTAVGTVSLGTGKAGNVMVTTNELQITDGGALTTTTFSQGGSGQLIVNTDAIAISGVSFLGGASALSTSSFGSGNSGVLNVNTRTLALLNGGSVAATAFAKGDAGSVNINASESIKVSGFTRTTDETVSSTINSSVLIAAPVFRSLLGLSNVPSGSAGTVQINSPTIIMSDRAVISVRNAGTGQGGNLTVNTKEIRLNQNSRLSAISTSGLGGNINLQTDLLTLSQGSSITATTGGNGDGGNIKINAPIILGLKNSDIIANASKGRGGNIEITTQGILGLKNSPQLTSKSDITASSEFGVNGTVDINNFGVDPNSGLVELPVNLVDLSQQIVTGCSANQGSSFVATGRGGIPQNPTQEVRSDVYDGLRLRTWSDTRHLTAYRKIGAVTAQIPESPKTLVQATSWHRNAQGKIEIVADKSSTQMQQPLTCAAVTKI